MLKTNLTIWNPNSSSARRSTVSCLGSIRNLNLRRRSMLNPVWTRSQSSRPRFSSLEGNTVNWEERPIRVRALPWSGKWWMRVFKMTNTQNSNKPWSGPKLSIKSSTDRSRISRCSSLRWKCRLNNPKSRNWICQVCINLVSDDNLE